MENREEGDSSGSGGGGTGNTGMTPSRGGLVTPSYPHNHHNHRGHQHQHQRQMNWARHRSMSISGGGSTFLNYPGHHHYIHNLHHHFAHHHIENGNGGLGNSSTSNTELIASRQRRASEGSASLLAKRAKRWRRRHPLPLIRNTQGAPNNNNEFLMDEHDHDPPYCDDIHYSSPEDEEDYQSRDFTQTYNVLKSERLHGMSKEQLIYANQLLEQRVESLETKLNEILKEKLEEKKVGVGEDGFAIPNPPPPRSSSPTGGSRTPTTLRFVKQEMLKLRQENWELKMENSNLKSVKAKETEGQDEAAHCSHRDEEAQQMDNDNQNHHEDHVDTEEEEEGLMETECMASPHRHHHFFRPAQTTAGI
ncbi:unnamed protein product [Orchesella dallaii]|uniref:Uncharacterized protein n=1 Tax=Orchesella dallaii TaxID=48710 RepID=A0ABP1R1W0_9HEXA